MLWRMLRGSLTKQRRGKLLAVITIALGASLVTAMLNVMLDVGDKMNRELKTYGANLLVVPRLDTLPVELYGVDFDPLAARQYLAEEDLGKIKTIFWANNILGFAPYLEVPATLAKQGRPVTVVGTWFNRRLELPTGESFEAGIRQLKPWWEITGTWVDDDDADGALVGSLLAQRLGVRPGDRVEVVYATGTGQRRQSLTIRGVLYSGGPEEERIYAPLRLVQAALNLEGKVSKVEVSALTTPENELARKAARDPESLTRREWETWYCTAYVSSIAYQIEEVIPGARAKPILQVSESEGAILRKIQALMFMITLASLLSSALGISNLVTASVLERSREIGLLKALGAGDGAVLLIYLAETAAIGLVGGLLGYTVGLGFAQVIGRRVFGAAVGAKGLVVPLVVLLSVGVALIGSVSAMRIVMRLRPADVLHGR